MGADNDNEILEDLLGLSLDEYIKIKGREYDEVCTRRDRAIGFILFAVIIAAVGVGWYSLASAADEPGVQQGVHQGVPRNGQEHRHG